jgi:hypothetical protein
MSTNLHHRFTKPNILRRIRKEIWTEFLRQFGWAPAPGSWEVPENLEEPEFYDQLQSLFAQELPQGMNEALVAISDMATQDGEVRLKQAIERSGRKLHQEVTREEFAMKEWLADVAWFEHIHAEHYLQRLSAFSYFAGSREHRNGDFQVPNKTKHDEFCGKLDSWFRDRDYGDKTVNLRVLPINDEFWFVIDHGDTLVRRPKAENKDRPVMQFRPARDDVVVYWPRFNLIRVNARTSSAIEMYRSAFGAWLFGKEGYFRPCKYSLEPLRSKGSEILITHEGEAVSKVLLKEIEVSFGREAGEVRVHRAKDLFDSARLAPDAIPRTGELKRAVFEFFVPAYKRSRRVTVRPPNNLSLIGACDPGAVFFWLMRRGFAESVQNPMDP